MKEVKKLRILPKFTREQVIGREALTSIKGGNGGHGEPPPGIGTR